MTKDLFFGIQTNGIKHSHFDEMPDIDTRLAMVKDTGVFDYVDKTPAPDEIESFERASEKYDLPIRCGGWFYMLKRDEALLLENLRTANRLGSIVHNVQVFSHNAEGRIASDEDIVEFYEMAMEEGDKLNVQPSLEGHVNMWSEDFLRVERVGLLAEARGLPFRITLDHSHIIFKIDNLEEQEVFDIKSDITDGRLVLDPAKPNNICSRWIQSGWVRHCHARSVVPNNPKNTPARDENGKPGRGIQYPFADPGKEKFHAAWDEKLLEPWKSVIRELLLYHFQHSDSQLGQISTEFIPNFDYGEGCKYSLFEQSTACAKWMGTTWENIKETSEPLGH